MTSSLGSVSSKRTAHADSFKEMQTDVSHLTRKIQASNQASDALLTQLECSSNSLSSQPVADGKQEREMVHTIVQVVTLLKKFESESGLSVVEAMRAEALRLQGQADQLDKARKALERKISEKCDHSKNYIH